MQKKVIITGIAGQDGYFLANLLHKKKYTVYGVAHGQSSSKIADIEKRLPFVHIFPGEITDITFIVRLIKDIKPDEIYNLAAISHVGYSFKDPLTTIDVNVKGVLNILEAIRMTDNVKKIKFYQASTSEMFGGTEYNRPKKGYDESCLFHPRSPYGCAKLCAHWLVKNYRESYGMYAVSGILFNHESEMRGYEFVTRKITHAVARIKLGLDKYVELGNLDAKRDWGYAGDYVEGMYLMLQQKKPDDYVLATGETHSIKEFLSLAFKEIGINDWKPYVKFNPAWMRPAEVDLLVGNPSKAIKELKWKRKVNFKQLVKIMVENDIKIESKI
ncbi:MAG: GDP-mannose 4,6-dehydratase [Mycoplasmoidaceae bacterium]|nr:MAG: GDP-mannose 4,6-dehydratase [Mycoplasmoidaceae bacterium]